LHFYNLLEIQGKKTLKILISQNQKREEKEEKKSI